MSAPLLIGNGLAFVAACFTVLSAVGRDKKRVYLWQVIQCLVMAAANVFFASFSGVTTFVLCALRNLLVARDRFTPRLCAAFVAAVGLIGLFANNRGLVGLLPIAATALYTVVCLRAETMRAVKTNLIVNLALWAVYDLFILDFVSCAVDGVSALAAALSLRKAA